MNRLHLIAKIQRKALLGKPGPDGKWEPLFVDGKELFGSLNREDRGITDILKRSEIENFAQAAIDQVKAALFPVERRRMALDVNEGELRADILDALSTLDLEKPDVARNVYEAHAQVGGSTGRPSMDHAVLLLEELGAAELAESLRARIDELYPLSRPDDDDGKPDDVPASRSAPVVVDP